MGYEKGYTLTATPNDCEEGGQQLSFMKGFIAGL